MIRDYERANAETRTGLEVLERLAEQVASGELNLDLKLSRPDAAARERTEGHEHGIATRLETVPK